MATAPRKADETLEKGAETQAPVTKASEAPKPLMVLGKNLQRYRREDAERLKIDFVEIGSAEANKLLNLGGDKK